MQNSFRWYGPSDPVSLSDIRQSNAEYIVTSLHQIPYGEKWNKNDRYCECIWELRKKIG